MASLLTPEDNSLDAGTADACGVDQYLPELPALWQLTRGSSDICVAVLDGPIDCQHPAFDGANLKQLDAFTTSGRQRGMPLLHGTHVTSLILGQHPGPLRGVAPRCRGVVIPVFDQHEDGTLILCSQLDLARAISLAMAVGANVINISGGRNDATGQPEPVLAKALEMCVRQGVLIVASAGNDGCRCLHVPAASPAVLAVGALDQRGRPWEHSNWGDAYRSHGLLAPGEDILGAAPGGQLARLSGTSLAAALVSGVAALLMSLQIRGGRPADASTVRTALIDGATRCQAQEDVDCSRLLAGRLNIAQTLTLLIPGGKSLMSDETPSAEISTDRSEQPESSPPRRAVSQVAETALREPSGGRTESSGCGAGAASATLVYALGMIDYDFGSEARRDAFVQRDLANPADQHAMLAHLAANPWEAMGLTWTLVQESTPIYAVLPSGPFAAETHQRLREILDSQLNEGVTQVSIPGILGGSIPLINGQRVPIIYPDLRGMYFWSKSALIEAVLGKRPGEGAEQEVYDRQVAEIGNFLDRVYYELSNLGVAPQDRAINHAATNLFQVAAVYREAVQQGLRLDGIEVERSSICRPGSDCWDVKVTLFDPLRRHERAKEIYKLTVDVSEVLPVTVGRLRKWSAF